MTRIRIFHIHPRFIQLVIRINRETLTRQQRHFNYHAVYYEGTGTRVDGGTSMSLIYLSKSLRTQTTQLHTFTHAVQETRLANNDGGILPHQ